ncbi:MAG: hypothetical protein J6O51_01490 [Bacteroidales bacterium]|nr:hypothetical protein [Bacteroidales bacterium]
MINALHSKYIIDGVPREVTPAGILASVMDKVPESPLPPQTILDETFDPAPGRINLDPSRLEEYLHAVLKASGSVSVPFAAPSTRNRVAAALIDSMWRSGNFALDDLHLTAKWCFDETRVGDMAAFYASVEAAADYIDTLRLSLRRVSCENGPFDVHFATPFSGAPLLVDDVLHPDPQSWIVYLPFDTSDYHLGNSLLSQALGLSGGLAPQVVDADYLMDCFEVVREFAQDGVLLSAATVSGGGLYAALGRMAAGGTGVCADISGVMRACGEKDPVRVLFGEVPGAVIQIRDLDFDYIDAEFLLQDVAYFPLGHPSSDGKLYLAYSAVSGIQTILDSLMQNAEGED